MSLTIYLEQKLLLYFKKARIAKKKTAWRAENGQYNLYIDNVKVEFSDSEVTNSK